MKYQSKFIYPHSRKYIWKCCLQNVGHFVSASMCKMGCINLTRMTEYQDSGSGNCCPIILSFRAPPLTHWGWVTHIYISNLTIIGSDNGLSPCRHQAIIWTSAGILLIGPSGTNFSGILIEIHTFSFKKIHLKMPSGKWLPFCLSLNV